jgi:hypothetical protein
MGGRLEGFSWLRTPEGRMVGPEGWPGLACAGVVAAAVFSEVADPAFPVPAGAAVVGALEVVAVLGLVLVLACAAAA